MIVLLDSLRSLLNSTKLRNLEPVKIAQHIKQSRIAAQCDMI
jgi:hypothetical protein